MMTLQYERSLWRRFSSAAVVFIVSLILIETACPVHALTIMLDFVSGPTTDYFGTGTTTADYAPFGFTANPSFSATPAAIQAQVFSRVQFDFLGYPSVGTNPASPLPNASLLNIQFESTMGLTAPVNGDTDYYYLAIGDNTTGDGFLGAACASCVRGSNSGAVPNHSIVGSILIDNLARFAVLADLNSERVNLIVGTISHEIGHSLSLDDAAGPATNPGASIYDLMATGVAPTNMPSDQRILDRAFSYEDFAQLVDVVGIVVPVPGTLLLVSLCLFLLLYVLRRSELN